MILKHALAVAFAALLTATPSLAATWNMWGEKDEMGRGTVQFATTTSTNTVRFSFPYAGPQHARLILRQHPRMGLDVILQIERGQFICRIDGCRVLVRFDDGKPETFYGASAADGSTTVLFIRPSDRFIGRLRKSRRARIEAQFYQEGVQVLDFPTDALGLWPPR